MAGPGTSQPEITPLRRYEYPRRASSFEVGGTANYPGAVALGAAVALLNRIGTTQIEDRVLALAESVADGLDELGLHVVTHREPEVRSGITTFTASSRPEANEALLARLLDQHVLVSLRYTAGVGGIRVSTHAYNTEADVGAFLDAVKRSLPLP